MRIGTRSDEPNYLRYGCGAGRRAGPPRSSEQAPTRLQPAGSLRAHDGVGEGGIRARDPHLVKNKLTRETDCPRWTLANWHRLIGVFD